MKFIKKRLISHFLKKWNVEVSKSEEEVLIKYGWNFLSKEKFIVSALEKIAYEDMVLYHTGTKEECSKNNKAHIIAVEIYMRWFDL